MTLAQLTAKAIIKALTLEQIKALSEDDFENLAMAYASSEVKKFDQFVTIYKTRPEARTYFQQKILMMDW